MIYLFVSTFGNNISWIKFPNKIPIEVGSACRDEKHPTIYLNKDNEGKNISIENPYYGELTGLYYIWKNRQFKSDDIIGFTHYNKILNISPRKLKKNLNSKKQWVVRYPEAIPAHKFPNDIYQLEEILKKDFPIYYKAWIELYDKKGHSLNDQLTCSASQMFFTSSSEFNKYCSFIFSVLAKLRKEVGDVSRSSYHQRYCAFVGERLLSVYLKANDINPICLETINKGGTRLGAIIQNYKRKHSKVRFLNGSIVKFAKKVLLGKRTSSYK